MTITVIGDNTGNDFAGTEDTKLREQDPTLNFGTATESEITKYNVGDHSHTILSFSGLSNITGPVIVNSATISIYQAANGGGTHTLSAYRQLRNFVENQATWNIFATGNNWQTAGGLGADDRSGTLSAAATANNVNGYKTWSAAQLATDHQNIINVVNPNYGWHFERTDGLNDSNYRVVSTSDTTDGFRPYTTVDHVPASAVVIHQAIYRGRELR